MAPLPPQAENLIRRVYWYSRALQTCNIDTVAFRSALLISMDEAFLLLDCARNGPWQMSIWAPNRPGADDRVERFHLEVQPQPGMAWASLFGIMLIIDADVSSHAAP